MKGKYLVLAFCSIALAVVASVAVVDWRMDQHDLGERPSETMGQFARYAPPAQAKISLQPVDFTYAAKVSTPTVVHIKTLSKQRDPGVWDAWGESDELFRWFYGDRYKPDAGGEERTRASGSGVIIDQDGYIVTNNHVVDMADEILVTFYNNKEYKASLVGTDKDTDLALLKIEADEVAHVKFADSDSVMVGEWVLAVGNPFNLSSTVTAGIVSAKGRNINILRNSDGSGGNTAVESFIQTDAAVNPGNSGGALVNMHGDLIGINTAIATPTGAFAGYSFAVPSNLVKKVVEDLREFGVVQRGFLGVQIETLNEDLREDLKIDISQGVVVSSLVEESAAELAGLRVNDVIVKVGDNVVRNASELQEQVARYRPGDELDLLYYRNGKKAVAKVVLKNKYNEVSLVDDQQFVEEILGAKLREVDKQTKDRLRLLGGVQVTDIQNGRIKEYTDIKEDFIITHINEVEIFTRQDVARVLKNASGNVTVEGVYPNKPYTFLYAFKM